MTVDLRVETVSGRSDPNRFHPRDCENVADFLKRCGRNVTSVIVFCFLLIYLWY